MKKNIAVTLIIFSLVILCVCLAPSLVGATAAVIFPFAIGYMIYKSSQNKLHKYFGIIIMIFGVLAILGTILPPLLVIKN